MQVHRKRELLFPIMIIIHRSAQADIGKIENVKEKSYHRDVVAFLYEKVFAMDIQKKVYYALKRMPRTDK